jgi:hypothetical protein
MRGRNASLLVVALVYWSACSGALPSARDGDIIFQTSRSSQSVAIQRATHSPYSHMGIVFFRHGQPYVLEASATVRYTPLDKWIAHGFDGRSVVKRLRGGHWDCASASCSVFGISIFQTLSCARS